MEEYMQSDEKAFCISVGTAITRATNKKNNASQHDSILMRDSIANRIVTAENRIIETFGNIGELSDFDFESTRSNQQIDSEITIRLGLPMYLLLMDKFNISEVHISGTGLWYGIYLQHLFNAVD